MNSLTGKTLNLVVILDFVTYEIFSAWNENVKKYYGGSFHWK